MADAFRATGITHIIAVSGFNVAIVSGLFIKLLGRLLRARFAIPLAMLAVAGYTLLTGASPSVVRAAVMGGIGMIGPLLGRRQVGSQFAGFHRGRHVPVQSCPTRGSQLPAFVWSHIGFGPVCRPAAGAFYPRGGTLAAAPMARRLSGPVGEFFLFTLAAQIFTLPITALNFQQVSLAALAGQPPGPARSALCHDPGWVALALGMVLLPLGQLVAGLCWPLLAFTIHVAEWLAQFQNSVLNVGSLKHAAGYFILCRCLRLPYPRGCAHRLAAPSVLCKPPSNRRLPSVWPACWRLDCGGSLFRPRMVGCTWMCLT